MQDDDTVVEVGTPMGVRVPGRIPEWDRVELLLQRADREVLGGREVLVYMHLLWGANSGRAIERLQAALGVSTRQLEELQQASFDLALALGVS